MHQEAFLKAIKIIGGQSKLAKILGVSRSKVNNWLNRDKSIPYEFILAIEAATEGKVSRQDFSPKLARLINQEKTQKLIDLQKKDTNETSVLSQVYSDLKMDLLNILESLNVEVIKRLMLIENKLADLEKNKNK